MHQVLGLHGALVKRRGLGFGREVLISVCNINYKLYLVFGRFPVELGPETRSNGSGSKNGAERTQN